MTVHAYVALLEPDADGGCSVYFPDLPGCTSHGADVKGAMHEAMDALTLHLDGMEADGDAFPAGRDVDAIYRDEAEAIAAGARPAYISVQREETTERVNVSLPKSLLARIDRFGEERGMTRSSVFGLAVTKFMAGELDQSAPRGHTQTLLARKRNIRGIDDLPTPASTKV